MLADLDPRLVLAFWILVTAAASAWAGFVFGQRSKRATPVQTEQANTAVEHIGAALAEASEKFNQCMQDLTQQRNMTEEARRRADEFFRRIDGCVKEATEAKSLYYRASAEHGAAQAILMRCIDGLAKQYRWLASYYERDVGKPAPRREPEIDPIVRRVAAEFEDEHAAPGRAALEQSDRAGSGAG